MSTTTEDINGNAPSHLHSKHIGSLLKMWFLRSFRFIIPIGCSVLLICWLFHKIDFGKMMSIIAHGVNYWWILGAMVCVVLSYNIRAARWGLQLNAVGIKPSYGQLSASIYGAYGLDLLLSGLGDAWRCLYISKIKKASISTVVGTDIGDRSTDLIVVILIFLFTLIVANPTIHDFLHHYPFGEKAEHFVDNPWLWGGLFCLIGIFWAICHFYKNYKLIDSIDGCIMRIWNGFCSVFTVKRKWLFLWLTLGIWVCYFLQIYFSLLAFPFTKPLFTPALCHGMLPALVALMFCSMSMVIPSSGGLGPWNLAIIFALTVYGMDETEAAALAMVAWSAQAISQVIVGLYSLYFVVKNKS